MVSDGTGAGNAIGAYASKASGIRPQKGADSDANITSPRQEGKIE